MTRRLFFITTIIYIFISFHASVYAFESGGKTRLSASISAKGNLRIFGYTSSNSLVQAMGIRTYGQTESDRAGYFLFDNLPLSAEAEEICLATLDSERRVGFPLCIPIPQDLENQEIGPLLLSPTVSLSKGLLIQNSEAEVTGKTIPNSDVSLSLFEAEKTIVRSFIKTAHAGEGNKVALKTDAGGNFRFRLPTDKINDFRLFAVGFYENNPTLKSQTLSYSIVSLAQDWLWNIFPALMFILMLLILTAGLYYWDRKTGQISYRLEIIYETRLQPLAATRNLRFRRLWYNFRQFLRKYHR